ncbi:Metal-dependent hydrolase, endonuclease/exonuclease/phosphatase family [Actinopolyspora mzabensis]|uniref:Metal-dependent hydrolase, endonuclease/exonuclease/phosphatase family n=1 Tax=Actinopolyspora mzabensis TaxID=995066 RepID=A0A1G9F0Q1_ACTMZ|nr:endonuclease/exonuclease/phosphatase family protein [Actinopolyspora mzabensis]SDK81997.1 Metal-dependent hydrolase, endonuclease/exonuclease/phosphatase family [Actinopolyspora mzabensis]
MLRATVIVLSLLLAAPEFLPAPQSTGAAGSAAGCGLPSPHLRIMQYNIHSGRDSRGRLHPRRTASVIERAGAEVVALQEVDVHWSRRSAWRDQVEMLASRLGMSVFFAPIYTLPPSRPGYPKRRFGLAVLSEHPLLATTNHRMTRRSTQHPSDSPVRLPGFPEVVVDIDGTAVHVYAAHLDYRKSPRTRRIQVREIVALLDRDEPSAPRLLLGDLNATSRAPELVPLWKRLRDAAGHTGAPTYPAQRPRVRLDHIAVSRETEVVCSTTVASAASDHLPVVAELRIPS